MENLLLTAARNNRWQVCRSRNAIRVIDRKQWVPPSGIVESRRDATRDNFSPDRGNLLIGRRSRLHPRGNFLGGRSRNSPTA